MIVCIAEKPSVARDIAHVLGASNRCEGFLEGNGYQVTWTYGHLCTLKEPQDYSPQWRTWRMEELPMVPQRFGIKLISNPTYERQFHVIERLMQQADLIVNCGDAGQEGELIQRWVMQKAGARCPVKRLWISSLTEEAIREGFNHLRDAADFQPLYEAGLSRAIGDWLLGMNATRLYTLKYGGRGQVLSVGRVQTPTLALIVHRQQEIQAFVPQQYWVLTTIYRNTTFTAIVRKTDEELAAEAEQAETGSKPQPSGSKKEAASAKRNSSTDNPGIEPITDHARGLALVERIQDKPFTVTGVSKKQGREYPPRLFDLTSLQVECNKRFGYSADETLRTIQSLYEKKFTTYPRVDTTFLSDDIYPKCPAILRGLLGYEGLTRPLEGTTLAKSKKVFDNSKVTDHHAIIPTGQGGRASALDERERRVFDLVARRFIAVFYPDCRVANTTVTGRAGDVDFKVTGRQVLSPGWRDVMAWQNPAEKPHGGPQLATAPVKGEEPEPAERDGEPAERTLPAFTKGESGPHQPSLTEKWTQPPRPYTEATLLRAMETAGRLVDSEELRDALKENGIGRPSTRAAIIETLFKRGYIRKERKNLVATPTGVQLVMTIRDELLKSAELTGIWEKKLREIERQAYTARQFLDELKQMVGQIVDSVKASPSQPRLGGSAPTPPEAPPVRPTPSRPPRKPSGAAGKVATTATTSAASTSQPAVRSPRRKASQVPSDDLIGRPCPLCGRGRLLKGKTAYGCSEWRNGCTYRLPFRQGSSA